MARYLDSVCKLCRRCGMKLALKGGRCATAKCAMERQGKGKGAPRRRRRVSDRGLQLMEKQKVRYSYGLLERQFRRVFAQAERTRGVTGENLLALLESRLDNVVYRLGFADSRSQARQLVQHGHILLNGRKATIPSSLVKEGDTIGWSPAITKSDYYKQMVEGIGAKFIVSWLSLDRQNLVGRAVSMPTPDEIGTEFDSKAIVEYYSR